MLSQFKQLDLILRGEKTRLDALRKGEITISIRGIGLVIIILGAITGACMGTFALLREDGPVFQQMLASAVKVPALFLLTLLITLPSLYVFNALVGSRLTLPSVVRLLIAGLAVTLAMLAAWGPIVAFFSLSTESYPFMVLLNVAVFAFSGLLGMMFVQQTLHRLTLTDDIEPLPPETSPQEPESPPPVIPRPANDGPLDMPDSRVLRGHVKLVFRLWTVVFGLVGAQMGWILRPFIGDPNRDFTWFRERDSSFFEAVFGALVNLLGG